MALPRTRSMNADLHEGATDGKYKKVAPNRGGVLDPLTNDGRLDLEDKYYGIHEADPKHTPDGTRARTPSYIPTDKECH